ncbi:MAG: hypothetical protein R6V01_01875 [Thermoplasmatota archaeon]
MRSKKKGSRLEVPRGSDVYSACCVELHLCDEGDRIMAEEQGQVLPFPDTRSDNDLGGGKVVRQDEKGPVDPKRTASESVVELRGGRLSGPSKLNRQWDIKRGGDV